MNPNGVQIIEYFVGSNPALSVTVSTNGAARNKDFWQSLGVLGITVIFALDGLEDTHHLYRQNTVWSRVIKNAQTFIAAGGRAVWQMIKFYHNTHQIGQCQSLSKQLGFADFDLIDSSRNTAPVFDQYGKLTHTLGNYQGEKEFPVLFYKKQNDTVLLEDIVQDRQPSKLIQCETKQLRSIYIAANGDVSPCCYTGFYPRTYGHGQYHQAANAQLVPMIFRNNALEYSIAECIAWFSQVEQSWNLATFEQGHLIVCSDNCGKN
jgi:MoaA/NifB/PqqE/SkfB family radical SAM enzyme